MSSESYAVDNSTSNQSTSFTVAPDSDQPTAEQIAQYKADGTWDQRVANVTAMGNLEVDQSLIDNLNQKLNSITNNQSIGGSIQPSSGRPTSTTLPSIGTVKMLIMLVDFPDYPHDATQSVSEIQSIYFGDGSGAYNTSINYYPYESLHNWYQRSSYGLLNITGDVVGWYTAQHNRTYYADRMDLMMEVMNYYDGTIDFSQYDNNDDGYMEGVALKYAGPTTGWGSMWWSYVITLPSSNNYAVDGVKMNKYMWAKYSAIPKTDIHETGHLLGLPDLYDYETGSSPYTNINGPGYGVGGLDMMDGGSSDFNCFFKLLLGWINPYYVTNTSAQDQQLILNVAELNGTHSSVVIFPGQFLSSDNKEFYMVEYRKKTGNDILFTSSGNWVGGVPTNGLYIWHIDATLDQYGKFFYDNSYTVHNLVDLVQADGFYSIQNDSGADAGDVYRPSNYLGVNTAPNSNWYNGTSGIYVYNLGNPTNNKNLTFATFGWQGPLSIGVAVENEILNWTTNGTGNVTWFGTQNMGQNDNNSAQSGAILDNEKTWMVTQFSGPGYLSFDWKVSSEFAHDFLSFYIDGVLQESISGELNWDNLFFTLGSGNHILNWTYSKDASGSNGSDCAWVDNVMFSNQTNIYVAPDGDDTFGTGSPMGPYKTLAKAIAQLMAGGSIHMANGTYSGVNNRGLIIDKNMAIIFDAWKGSGAAIFDAENTDRIFSINSGVNFTIQNLTIINGNSSLGGAIWNAGNFSVWNGNFINNTAGTGGAIYIDSGNLNIVNSVLYGNTALYGGAIFNKGTVILINSLLSGNNAIADGGAINSFSTGVLTIINSTLGSNVANNGGAISNDGNLNITRTLLLNNIGTGSGSAIYNAGIATINFNRILNNIGTDIYSTVSGLNATNNWWGTNFQGNNPLAAGRVNSNVNANPWIVLTVDDTKDLIGAGETSIITANLRYNSIGEDTLAVYGQSVPNINVLFTSNFGSVSPGNGTISNGLNATTTFKAGSIPSIRAVNATVDNQTVSLVRVMDRNNVYVAPDGNDATGNGSPHYPFQTLIKAMAEVQTIGNVRMGNGTYSGANNTVLTINKNMTILFDTWRGTGTAIIDAGNFAQLFYVNGGVSFTIQNLTLINGNASNGGAIYNRGNFTAINCSFNNNNAINGAGIYNYLGNCTFTDCIILNNKASGGNGGAGIYNYKGNCLVSGGSILNNTASSWGGGIFNYQGNFTITNVSILNNTATSNGAGIYNYQGNCLVIDSLIQNNTANSGAGIYNDNGNCTVSGDSIVNNSATNNGGGIYNNGNCTVIDSTIQNNTANSSSYGGGGVYNALGASFTVTNSSIVNNTANYRGGAMYNAGNCTVNNCSIVNNTGTSSSGGVHNTGNFMANNSSIQNNAAKTYYGGAIRNEGNCTINACFIVNNTAVSRGGAIYSTGNCIVINSTLINNTANMGSAIYTTSANSQISFNRIFNNMGNGDVYSSVAGVNATNNWWGTNFNGTNPLTAGRINSNVTVNSWIVLILTANPNGAVVTDNSIITADLTYDNNGIYHDPALGHVPNGVNAKFAVDNLGSVSPINNLTNNGIASTIFTALASGFSKINVTVDNQTIGLEFIIGALDLRVRNYEWYPNRNNSYVFGESAPYVSYVMNYGPVDATNVVVKYSIGSGLIFKGYSILLDGVTNVVFDGQNLTYYVNYLPVNGYVAIIVYLQVNATGNQTSELTTNASLVSVNQTESGSKANFETKRLTVANSADIQVTQDAIVYNNITKNAIITLNVKNNGPNTATNININDTLPEGMVYTGHSAGENYNSGIWYIDNLSSGNSKTLEIYVNVTATTGTLLNTVKKVNSTLYDSNFANDAQTMNLTIDGSYTPTLDLRVRNYEWYPNRNNSYVFGESAPYVSYVMNYGPSDATNVVVKYNIGSGFIYRGYSILLDGVTNVVFDGQNLTYYVNYLPVNGYAAIIVYLQVNATGNQTSELTTNASLVSVNQTESGSKANFETKRLTVANSADIQIKQDINGMQELQTNNGENIVLTVTVTNKGPNNCDNIVIEDFLTGLTYVGNDKGAVYDSGILNWNISSLTSGESINLHITVKAESLGDFTIFTSKKGPNVPYDWNYANDAQTIHIARLS